ncbi:MAG: sigma 54-dependent Fis family transcriptional regulator [Polyangiaceae bacterium]|nr:sigma 54-dependent Fis family transcriptional regulator [Polyangiaceae bacterium]
MTDSEDELATRSMTANVTELPGVRLYVLDGPDVRKTVPVGPGVTRVGTAPSNQLVLTDQTVSRLHCEVRSVSGQLRITDRQSTNGTFVDGVRVVEAFLLPGSTITMGHTTLSLERTTDPVPVELSERSSFAGLLGASVEMRRIYALLARVAPTTTTVLVRGETGTGKELVARALHHASPRRDGPFVAVDCGAIPESLFESELFGHVRGAFTGAVAHRPGAFREAHGGTLFFDEIGELPQAMQPKLLRALETREVRAVGASHSERVDVRVVAATHRDLASEVNSGAFREDLYYRLAVVEVELPGLAARREDIPVLAQSFFERATGREEPVPEGLLRALLHRPWPGNVRELRNTIERWVALGAPAEDLAPQATVLSPAVDALVPRELPFKEARQEWLDRFERVYVQALLDDADGNVTHAAERAGVSRRFLQRMMARLRIRDESEESSS